MAAPRTRRGFTLVELLVVITIIGMLMALLLPAIQSAREAGRRNTCANNMRNDGFALYQQAEAKKGFPGYVQAIPKTNIPVTPFIRASWVVSILPNLEQNALYQNWMNPSYNVNPSSATSKYFGDGQNGLAYRQTYMSQISVLVCPSNSIPDLGDNPLSYVINTGSALTANDNHPSLSAINWKEDANSGISFNQSQKDSNWGTESSKKVSLDFINTNDGTSHTLLLSENLQSGKWAEDPQFSANSNSQAYVTDFAARQSVGFVWFVTGNANNAVPPASFGGVAVPAPPNASSFDVNAIGINSKAKTISGIYPKNTYSPGDSLDNAGLAYARPSSNHPGGVNMVFCDGHLSFVNDEIPYHVYTQLMTPFQKQVIVKTSAPNTAATNGWLYTLNEADYQ